MADDTYMMLNDGQVEAVDLGPMMRRHRASVIDARADAIDQAADLLMIESLDVHDVVESARDRIGRAGTAAALNIAFELGEIEHLRE